MPAPTQYNIAPQSGVDVTTYYANISASVSPETPAPPFQVGEIIEGNQGSEFIFVQASTSIALGDFVAIQNGFFTNSLTSTNVISSLGCQIAMAGTVLAQSLTFIPAGAFFWAAIRGSSLSGNAASALTAGAPVQLFTTATAGAITSVTTSFTLAAALAGIEVVSSVTPIFKLTWPRTAIVVQNQSLAAGPTLMVNA
jgi:hypothetical protein